MPLAVEKRLMLSDYKGENLQGKGCGPVMTELTIDDIKEDAAKEENDMIVRRFVSMVGYDYIRHDKTGKAQIYPDWSDDTKVFWEEIESRLKEVTVLDFDIEQFKKLVNDEIDDHKWHLKHGQDYTHSYHAGIKDGMYKTLVFLNRCTKKR